MNFLQTKRIRNWLVSGAVILCSLMLADTAYANVRGQLTGNHVRVRAYPCLESTSNILFQVSVGQYVEILDVSGDFYRVNVRDARDVYIFREFIEEVPYVPAISHYVDDVTNENDLHDEYLNYVDSEDYTAMIEELYQVLSAGGGYGSSFTIDELLEYAKSYIGTPYRFGSTDPSRGFDCSGFVTVVMRRFGISLQRSSACMAATNGVYVARTDLQPGDLVFFATGSGPRISHVGIYIGGNNFIHSASCIGVRISGMNEPYYRARYVRANRIF